MEQALGVWNLAGGLPVRQTQKGTAKFRKCALKAGQIFPAVRALPDVTLFLDRTFARYPRFTF
jgi:hypothetical protein